MVDADQAHGEATRSLGVPVELQALVAVIHHATDALADFVETALYDGADPLSPEVLAAVAGFATGFQVREILHDVGRDSAIGLDCAELCRKYKDSPKIVVGYIYERYDDDGTPPTTSKTLAISANRSSQLAEGLECALLVTDGGECMGKAYTAADARKHVPAQGPAYADTTKVWESLRLDVGAKGELTFGETPDDVLSLELGDLAARIDCADDDAAKLQCAKCVNQRLALV